MSDQAGVVTRPHLSREAATWLLSRVDGAPLTVGTVEMAWTAEGTTPAPGDYVAATVAGNGTAEVSASVLVGPTGDTAATKQLGPGRWTWWVRYVIGTERIVRAASLVLT